MRKYIFLLIAAMFLVACGSKYYKDIRETFGEDTESIIDIILESNDEERQLTESEQKKIDNYVERYENKTESNDESEAYMHTVDLIFEQDDSLLPSEKEDVKESSKDVRMILTDGKNKYWDHIEKEAEEQKEKKDSIRREGIDQEFIQDALEVTDEIDYWFNDKGFLYDELPEETYEFINEFDSDNYLGFNEELSREEEDIYIEVVVLESNYYLHGTESEEGIRDMTESINENIEKIRDLTKSID